MSFSNPFFFLQGRGRNPRMGGGGEEGTSGRTDGEDCDVPPLCGGTLPNPPSFGPGWAQSSAPPRWGRLQTERLGREHSALPIPPPSVWAQRPLPSMLNLHVGGGHSGGFGGGRPPQPPPPPHTHPPEGHLRVIEERPIGPHPRPRAIPAQPNPVLHGAPIAQHEPLWKRTAVGHDGPPGPPHRSPPPISPTPAGSPRRPIALRGTDRSAAPHPSLPRPPRSRSTAAQPRSHRWGSPGGGGRLWGRGGTGGVSGLEGSRRSCTGGPKAMLSPIMALRTSWGGRGPSWMGPH